LLPIQEAVSCVARAKITLSPNGRAMTGKIHALALNEGNPIGLKCKPELLLKIGMHHEIVRAQERTERGPWRVSTRGYKADRARLRKRRSPGRRRRPGLRDSGMG
jgi:hypothetical protein